MATLQYLYTVSKHLARFRQYIPLKTYLNAAILTTNQAPFIVFNKLLTARNKSQYEHAVFKYHCTTLEGIFYGGRINLSQF